MRSYISKFLYYQSEQSWKLYDAKTIGNSNYQVTQPSN